jgi:hypothetical protein
MLAWLQWRVTGEPLRRGVHGEQSMTEEDDRPVDRDGLAHSLGESPRTLPDPGGLFVTLQRVIEATHVVFQVDGASLALEHEDGSLRWVVVTDGTAGLLEDTQRELGEGPGLAAYGDAAAVVVVDLATDRRFERLAAVVTPRGLRGVLAVPVVVAGRPVGRCRCMPPSRVPGRGLTLLRWAPTPGWSPSCCEPAWRWMPGTPRWPS